MGQLKQRMTKKINCDFKNLTENIVDQKDTMLCVPISVSILLRWAIKKDLKVKDSIMEELFTVEKILTQLTMIIYPRSLAGLNLNPRKKEQKFQDNDIESLLIRMKNETYLHKSGWDIIRDRCQGLNGSFDFEEGKILNYLLYQPF